MRTDDFDFDLPLNLIAQHPPRVRGKSRLLYMNGNTLKDRQFCDFPGMMQAGDVLVLNDTRVIKARLFGNKQSGGKVEVLIERVLSEHEALAQVRASKSPATGSLLILAKGSPQSGGVPPDMPLAGMNDGLEAEVLGRQGEFFHLRFLSEVPLFELLERHGNLPLPPYIAHAAGEEDETRYQTVFARKDGAVAAPTAGLHFDDAMLESLASKGVIIRYVTLHVGAGTFQPVRVEQVHEHVMHSERYEIPAATADAIHAAKSAGKRVVAVGTTSLRALESAAAGENGFRAGSGETRIFITPGFKFLVVDALLTNFHLPRSTLLMLVSAFGGMDEIRAAYQHAIKNEYRFFSYGDAMLIERKPSE
jgi:S-adenosylmethionine:tRNA ribosyltransferase-isomerase